MHDGLMAMHPEILEVKAQKRAADKGGCGDRTLVLDALGTILSQKNHDRRQFARAFASLKAAFPSVGSSSAPLLPPIARSRFAAAALRPQRPNVSSSSSTRCLRSAVVISGVHARHAHRGNQGETPHLQGRRRQDDLLRAPLCLGRADFPVDTHVWKIALALGWVPKTADRDGTYAHLNTRSDELKYALHVLLVEHGKVYKNSVAELKKMASAIEELSVEARVPSAVKAEAKVKREM